jgi:hypothetical protein
MKQHRQGAQMDMEKLREILRLHELSYSQCEIARSCRVARATVQDYLRRAAAKGVSYHQTQSLKDSEILELLGKGRQSVAKVISETRYGELERELSRKGVTLALLWQEGLDRGEWNCSYGTFCRQYKQWRGRQNLSMRQVYQGGDRVFVDYCGMSVRVYGAMSASKRRFLSLVWGRATTPMPKRLPVNELKIGLGHTNGLLSILAGYPRWLCPTT